MKLPLPVPFDRPSIAPAALLRRLLVISCLWLGLSAQAQEKPLNVLILTTDDMSCDSVGAYGCKLPETTPHMDSLAARGVRFNQAHVVVGNCMPSRNVMWSGRYPHNNGIEGFHSLPKEAVKHPMLGDLMKAGGWFTGIRGKVSHSTPYHPFPWDVVLDADEQGKKVQVKDAPSYGRSLKQGIAAAREAGKPFCLMLNISDPHKPFYAEGKGGRVVEDAHVPSRVFKPEEIPVPGFLPDDPVIRQELALYYSSVRRADDAVGSILTALRESGEEERTIILFLSDHGMPLPFAKTQLYHHSTRTPLMIVWPGKTAAGRVEEAHLVSAVDLLPTILEMTDQPLPDGLDGRSMVPLLKGETQPGREMVFKSYHENSGGQRTPMRAVQTKDFLYIFNPWSNGTRVMRGATVGTMTCRQMRVLARTDEAVAARVDLFDHRRVAEAYDVRYDPDALTNLIDLPAHAETVHSLEKALEEWMLRTGDPLLEVFRKRGDAAFREAWMQGLEETAKSRRGRRAEATKAKVKGQDQAKAEAGMKGKAAGKGKRAPAVAQAEAGLIRLEAPEKATAGQSVTVKVHHTLHDDLGLRPLHMTLKGDQGRRIERQTVEVQGNGVAEATFEIPAGQKGSISFAALLGEDISTALQHLQTKPFPLSQD